MITLGITGGIGSGKSYITKIFDAMGYPVYDSDSRAKELYDENKELVVGLVALLGETIVHEGELQKHIMAEIIFNDAGKLEKIENLVFPAVIRDFEKWRQSQLGKEIVIFESALILEREAIKGVADYTITVSAPLELRISRAMRRDEVLRNRVEARVNNQISDKEREERADFTIISNEQDAVLPQIVNILKRIESYGNR